MLALFVNNYNQGTVNIQFFLQYSPPKDYVAICEAPKECVKHNIVQAGAVADSKPVNNAPQAIIIEVFIF